MTPELIKHAGELEQRPHRFDIGAVEDSPTFPADVYESHVAQHFEVLRHGRLRGAQPPDDVADGALERRQIDQNVPALRLGKGSKDVGGRGAWHGRRSYSD